jgi:phage shock protein E
MQWIGLIFVGFILAFIFLPRLSWISVEKAAERLKAGAVIVDVRSPGEFAAQRLNGAENIPLGQFAQTVEKKSLGGETEILLFCASGTRSAVALKQLKRMGYDRVWNIGGFSRAQQVVELAGKGR